MIVVGTGITGSGRATYLKNVVDYAKGQGEDIDFEDIGPRMFKKASSLRIEIPEDKILDLDITTLRFLRATVFEEIIHKADSYRVEKDLLISLHMSFRWRKVLLPAFDYYYLNKLDPDFYITLIDSISNIWMRINREEDLKHWRGRLNLKELLIWRDEEIFITSMVADMLNKQCYILSTSTDPRLLYNIIYNVEKPKKLKGRPRMLKAYLSYPMTMVRDREDFEEARLELVRKLEEKGVIVFDPAMVKDMVLVEKLDREPNADKIYVEDIDIAIPADEIREARQYIIDQTVVRDYMLIDQSDFIIVYYPVKELSAGVLSEMIYAHTHIKNVYALFTEENISPFFQTYSTKIFRDIDSLIEFIEELVKLTTEVN